MCVTSSETTSKHVYEQETECSILHTPAAAPGRAFGSTTPEQDLSQETPGIDAELKKIFHDGEFKKIVREFYS
jgi:hypothetical protein